MIKRRRSPILHHRPFHKSRYLVITENYLIPLGIIFLGFLSVYLLFFSPLFQVKQIACFRDQQPCQDPFILAEIKKYHSQNLFRFPQEELRSRLLQGNKTILQVKFSFHLPNQVRLDLVSTTPQLAIRLQSQPPRYLLIDQNFRPIMTTSSSANLPLIILDRPTHFQLGQVVTDPDLQFIFRAALTVSQTLNQPLTFSLHQHDVYLDFDRFDFQARLSTQQDLERQLQLLQAVLSNVKMLEEQQIKLIDVRFTQPVLKSY